jgi:hypothetical protein
MSEFYPIQARRAKDDPFRRRNVPAHALTALPPKFAAVIDLMIYGATEAVTIEGVALAAGMPLTLRQAARQLGVRLRAARAVSDTALFQGAFPFLKAGSLAGSLTGSTWFTVNRLP